MALLVSNLTSSLGNQVNVGDPPALRAIMCFLRTLLIYSCLLLLLSSLGKAVEDEIAVVFSDTSPDRLQCESKKHIPLKGCTGEIGIF